MKWKLAELERSPELVLHYLILFVGSILFNLKSRLVKTSSVHDFEVSLLSNYISRKCKSQRAEKQMKIFIYIQMEERTKTISSKGKTTLTTRQMTGYAWRGRLRGPCQLHLHSNTVDRAGLSILNDNGTTSRSSSTARGKARAFNWSFKVLWIVALK